MKYSIMISFFVICMVVATQIVDTLNNGYFLEKQRTLFGYTNGANPYAYSRTMNKLDQYSEVNINGTVYAYVDPNQQPSGTSILVWIDQWIKSLKGIGLIFSTLFYVTIGFGAYINNLFFMPLGGRLLFSDTLALFIGIALCIIHFLNIIAFIRGMQIGD